MIVTIPTCGESSHLEQLVQTCLDGDVEVVVVANNATLEQRQFIEQQTKFLCPVVDGGNGVRSLYTIWNQCMELTRRSGDRVGAIFNDDIEVNPESFKVVERSILRGHHVVGWDAFSPVKDSPSSALRRVYGTYRTHGLAGFAFAYDTHHAPSFTEDYTWWYGDDDWVEKCKSRNLALYVEQECGVKHHTSTSQRARPWVMRDVNEDKKLYESTWNKN